MKKIPIKVQGEIIEKGQELFFVLSNYGTPEIIKTKVVSLQPSRRILRIQDSAGREFEINPASRYSYPRVFVNEKEAKKHIIETLTKSIINDQLWIQEKRKENQKRKRLIKKFHKF